MWPEKNHRGTFALPDSQREGTGAEPALEADTWLFAVQENSRDSLSVDASKVGSSRLQGKALLLSTVLPFFSCLC